jgi:endoglucanase
MIKQDQHSRKRTHLLLAFKLLLILGLWVGGTYAFTGLKASHIFSSAFGARVQADGPVDIWWPTNNAKVSGLQPLKALVHDKQLSEYDVTWSVDGGQQNPMSDSTTDAPHKEASVDLTNWNWHGSGPYHIVFKAVEKSGKVIGESAIDIYGPEAAVAPKTIVNGSDVSAATTTAPASASSVIISAVSQATGVQLANAAAPAAAVVAPVTVAPSVPVAPAFLSVLAPATNSTLTGLTDFKASMGDMDTNSYSMYWQVDGGQRNDMYSSVKGGGAHKEASVDLNYWTWHGAGPYTLTFTAVKDGQTIGTSNVVIKTGANVQPSQVENQTPNQSTENTIQAAVQQKEIPRPQPVAAIAGNALSGLKFFVNPNSNAKHTADDWRSSRPNDAYQMDKIANSPEAIWLGGWSGEVGSAVSAKVSAAKSQGAVPIFVAYNIPNRDCGSYSAGGMGDASSYNSWIQKIAQGLGGSKAVIVLEPDALASTDCLSNQQKSERFSMLSSAVTTLKNAGARVYLDAGHPNWISADDMANRLNQAGIAQADGFALNVSNFYGTSENINYGSQVSAKVGSKHFVIDTSRNGLGATGDSQWCNPEGRALGTRNTLSTGNTLVDGYLWLKNPGESDGNCNGGPSAGSWWPDYALELAKRSAN